MNALFELKECIFPDKECIPSVNRSHSVTPHGLFFRQMNAFCWIKQGSMCPQTTGDVDSKNGHFSPPSPALQAERAGHVTSKAPSFALQPTTLLAQRTHTQTVTGPFLAPQAGQECPEYRAPRPLDRPLLAQCAVACSLYIGLFAPRCRRRFRHGQQGSIQTPRPSSPHLMHHRAPLADHATEKRLHLLVPGHCFVASLMRCARS
jgi:hypothetical protein